MRRLTDFRGTEIILSNENKSLKKKIKSLEEENRELLKKIEILKWIVSFVIDFILFFLIEVALYD